MCDQIKATESKVEVAKRHSRHLRGTLADTLASNATHFCEDDVSVLKFHGSYQQDDRDHRRHLRSQGHEKAYIFMVRCAIPGGQLTAEQYLALDRVADVCGNGTLRITTRQGIQFHDVGKETLRTTIGSINEALVSTLAACGDVRRNVMTCPAPLGDAPHVEVRRLADEIARELSPATRAYHEIWLDGEKLSSTENEEPFYGKTYLPRKFKSGVALDTDNCIDVYSQDCGLIAVVEKGTVRGFNLLAGGGLGMTHEKADTFAKLADPIGFVPVDRGVESVRTVAAIFRDHGNRSDRRHARLKYLIAEWGLDWFREEFQRRATFTVEPSMSLPPPAHHDHLSAHRQADGRWFYGVFVENGRVADLDSLLLRSALRTLVEQVRPSVTLTPQQSILFGDLTDDGLARTQSILRDHGVPVTEDLSAARRYSMSCPALPTCGLALAESERLMPSVIDRFEAALDELGLRQAPLTIRMTGCPNGCARPYTADIAFVGRRPDEYHVFVGGGLPGDRVADLYAADVPTDELVKSLWPLLQAWGRQRQGDESFSNFYQRIMGQHTPRKSISGSESPTQSLVQLRIQR